MICPYCGTHIPDNSVVCPACHAELDQARAHTLPQPTYCKSCGALIPAGATRCPACGMPSEVQTTLTSDTDASSDAFLANKSYPTDNDILDPESTNSIPRIESAIPSESTSGYARERMPHTKAVVMTALAALAIVGGAALIIAHPWDPNAFVTHNTNPRDTSKAGFPGTVDKLKGQDASTEDATTTLSADEANYKDLSSDYEQLVDMYKELAAADDSLETLAAGSDAKKLSSTSESVKQLTYSISNLISDVQGVDVSSGTYSDTKEHLLTLGNWLRNWCDSLHDAYSKLSEASNPADVQDEVLTSFKQSDNASGTNTYRALFEANYQAWKPVS